jgi:WD40 repeat protein
MTFDWNCSLLVSGDKTGVVGIWDLNRGELVRALKAHKGNVSKICLDGKSGLIYSIGLNDGTLAAIDMRTNQGAFKEMLHKGATNDIKIVDNKVVTCSADHTLNVL